MLQFLRGRKIRERKWRLFELAYARHIWKMLYPKRMRKVVEAAERKVERGLFDIEKFSKDFRTISRLPYYHFADGVGEQEGLLLVDIFGNPFHPTAPDGLWQSP